MSFALGKVVFRSPFVTRHPGDEIDVKTKESIVITTLRNTVESQRRTIIQLEHKLDDVSKQNEELRKSKVISPQEEAAFQNQTQLLMDQQAQLDQLALWLRENKKQEIAQGKHMGMTLVDTILMYLGGTMPKPVPGTIPQGKAN